MRAWLLLSLASLASGAQFSTTLHGAPTELIEPGTPGATTLQLQPWLTNYDPNVSSLACDLRFCCTRLQPHSQHDSALTAPRASGCVQRRHACWLLLESWCVGCATEAAGRVLGVRQLALSHLTPPLAWPQAPTPRSGCCIWKEVRASARARAGESRRSLGTLLYSSCACSC